MADTEIGKDNIDPTQKSELDKQKTSRLIHSIFNKVNENVPTNTAYVKGSHTSGVYHKHYNRY